MKDRVIMYKQVEQVVCPVVSCQNRSRWKLTPELREHVPGRGFMMTMRQSGWTSRMGEGLQRGILAQLNSCCRIHSHTVHDKNAHCCLPSRLVAVDDLSRPPSPCDVPLPLPPRSPALALGAPASHAPSPMALLKSMSGVFHAVVRPIKVLPCAS